MKKQYIFFILLIVFLYMLYLVISFKATEYKKNNLIADIKNEIENIKETNDEIESLISYKQTKAFKNKILKENQSLKGRKEKVMYLKEQREYNKFTIPDYEESYIKVNIEDKRVKTENLEIQNLQNYQRWIYYIFKDTKNFNKK